MIIDGLRYLTCDLKVLELMTFFEYKLRMKAYYLKEIDDIKYFVQKELLKRKIKATEKRAGLVVYKYSKVSEIFDYEKAEREVLGKYKDKDKEDKFDRLRLIASRVRKFKEEGGSDGI
ncbi:MAG: hypothetical protein PUI05_03690 [Peptoniphilaceae bacterium]|nr:hypothetical protein [Peptoniphilaceae bacterium]